MSERNTIPQRVRFTVPPELPGGHSPNAIDPMTVLPQNGMYPLVQNIMVANGGLALATRTPLLSAGELSASYRIVNLEYQPFTRVVSNVARGAFWYQKDSDSVQRDTIIRLREYEHGETAFWTSSKLQSEATPVFWPNAEGELEPGSGLWKRSSLGHIHASGGLPEANFDYGGPASMKLMRIDRKSGAPHYNGFFFLPNKKKVVETIAASSGDQSAGYLSLSYDTDDGWVESAYENGVLIYAWSIQNGNEFHYAVTAGRSYVITYYTEDYASSTPGVVVSSPDYPVEQFAVVPEKPWTSFGSGATYNVIRTFSSAGPYRPNLGYYDRTGKAYWGSYKYQVIPLDENLEPGPPLFSKQVDVPRFVESGYTHAFAGISLRHAISDIDVTKIRPNIQALMIYGHYRNPSPLSSYWDNGEHLLPGDPVPVDKQGVVAILNLNGRQFDPTHNEEIPQGLPGTGATPTSLPSSDRFNAFKTVGDTDGWVTGYRGDADEIKIEELKDGHRYWFSSEGANVYVQIYGYAGVWKITNWDDTDGTTPYTTILTLDNNVPSEFDAFDSIKFRFCYPPVKDSTDGKYSLVFWDNGPVYWDDSYQIPFPFDANEHYNVGYPFYKGHCESPSGERRLAWDAVSSFYDDDGTFIKDYEQTVLFYTTNQSGFHYRCRFPGSIDIKGVITGAAFIDETRFIVSTKDYSYLGQFVNPDGDQWIVDISRELEYGHSGRSMVAFNETVYGISHRWGPWAVGFDSARFRSDIAPVSGQQALMTRAQADWFFKQYGNDLYRLNEMSMVVTPEKIVIASSEINEGGGTSIPGAKYNVKRYPASTSANSEHFWLTLWRYGGGFWSYDFMASGTNYLPLFDLITGPHGSVFGHGQESALGDLWYFGETHDEGIADVDDDGNYLPIKNAIEFILPAPPESWPDSLWSLFKVYLRIHGRGEQVSYTHTVSASEEGTQIITLRHQPRSGLPSKITQNPGSITLNLDEDYTVSGRNVTFDPGTISENDTLSITYYPAADMDVYLTPVRNGDEANTGATALNNKREGWRKIDQAAMGEYVKVRIKSISGDALWFKEFFAWWQHLGENKGEAATTEPTGLYGLSETTPPVT